MVSSALAVVTAVESEPTMSQRRLGRRTGNFTEEPCTIELLAKLVLPLIENEGSARPLYTNLG